MTRTFGQLNGRRARGFAVVLATVAAALGCAAQAGAQSLTPGDVVVERDGSGGVEAITNVSTAVYLNEFTPTGGLVTALALPTEASQGPTYENSKHETVHEAEKPLLDQGSAVSDGELTLSGNAECLLTVGYDAPLGVEKVDETKDTTTPRTVAVINKSGEINTTTALTDFANENNARSATSNECTKVWVGGAGSKTTGGVVEAEVKKEGTSTGTQLDENDTNVRQVEVVDGQLYTSGDPEKAPKIAIGKMGSGLPSTKGQTLAALPFEPAEKAPEEPYGYSLLTLGLGSTPDTLYVADNKRSEVVKYGLSEGKWVERGAVEIPAELTGVTANDVGGAVTIYATSSGASGKKGTLYRISDVSGVNGTLSGIPVEIATAPANEAFRGVAFAPGTTIGSGGTPPPAPTISAAETALPAAIGDPTNATMPLTVGIAGSSGYTASELTVSVTSSKESVAPVSGITVTGSGAERTLHVTPAGVGISTLTLTVEAPDGVFTSTQISYGASEYEGSPSDRYYSDLNGAGSAIEVGGGYMLVASDESNILNLYHERTSGPPVRSYDFDSELPSGEEEVNIHSMARAGNTLYIAGSLDNTNSGEVVPSHDTIFAATITGSGANTELTYLGSYTGLKEDLVNWDNENGAPLGLAASSAPGQAGERPNGFKLQGVEFLPGSSTEAYLSFRAPLEPPGEGPEDRNLALVIPVTNFSSLFTDGNPGTTHATFGAPLEWNLGGLSIRQIRKNAAGEYVIVASTANSSDTVFQLWGWDGEPEDEPVLLNAAIPQIAEGVWSPLPSVPELIANGDGVEVLQDDSKVVWYGSGTKDAEKGLTAGLQKDIGRLITVEIPAPGVPDPPHLSSGKNPNKGQFTLKWKPAPTLRAEFMLEHQNARQKEKGEWSTVGSWQRQREYTFAAGNPEEEGTWTYRVKERNETGENSTPSEPSEPIKVDKTPPSTPTAAPSRAPDYTGKGGWYKNSVTVSFTSHGDPVLSDGSPGSGVNPASLTTPETFETSGSHEACGTVADYAENVSEAGCLTVQVDATPPTLEITCPATALVKEAGVNATVTASDAYSGLASGGDPSGTVPIDTSHTGPETVTRTAISNVGLETTRSCTTEVVYPAPGAPALTHGESPNNTGLFTLGWSGDNPMQYLGLSYTLQAHNYATSEWSTVESGIDALSYEFSGAGEQEGTWVFRVQGADSVNDKVTEYSPVSAPVVVDKTAPYAPSATASRPPDYAGNGGWYKNSVTVSFASDGDRTLSDGSPGSGVNPASISPPQTFSTTGFFEGCGTVTDYAGNVSEPGCRPVQVEATPPELEITCPERVLAGQSAHATVTATDRYSGLASDPSGTVPIDTSSVGPQTVTRTAVSNLGFETTKSCTTMVESSTPGAPALIHGKTPNNTGQFTLGWSGPNPLRYFGLSYTLQEHNSSTSTWTTVASGIEALSYQFSEPAEEEGTWVYRVQTSDPSVELPSEYSPESAAVVVDETPPTAPTVSASREPDYASKGGWYKNSVEVSFTSNGDPKLSDGSAGSGVNPASVPATRTFSTSGSHETCGTVTDYAGNVSKASCLTVQVDATPPTLEIECPASAPVGEVGVTATVTASDSYSGLASNPSGNVPINTSRIGPQTITRTAVSNVGLETTRSCTTQIVASPPEFGRCVKVSSEGGFTSANCETASKTRTGTYEWEPGVAKPQFTSPPFTKVTLETVKGVKVACSGGSTLGEYTTPRTVGEVLFKFTDCELASSKAKCTTADQFAGRIQTQPLDGVLGIDKLANKPQSDKLGLDLYPAGKTGPVMEFSCASTIVSVRGSVIVPVPGNKMELKASLKAKASKGVQKPESFAGGPKDVLEESVGGAPYEVAGLSVSITQENSEEVEISSVD